MRVLPVAPLGVLALPRMPNSLVKGALRIAFQLLAKRVRYYFAIAKTHGGHFALKLAFPVPARKSPEGVFVHFCSIGKRAPWNNTQFEAYGSHSLQTLFAGLALRCMANLRWKPLRFMVFAPLDLENIATAQRFY